MNALRAVYLRVHLFFVLARPPLIVLLGTFAALGVAHAGRAAGYAALAHALLVVVGFVAFAVAINDLSDAAVDRINLPGDRSRPLASGLASTLEMRVVAIVGAAVSFASSAAIGWACAAITLAGLLLASAYSLPPFQLSKRGIVAPLILPFAFVAVPFLAGILAVRPAVHATDLWLLAGLYLGFIGRILLKDFRDLRGDALLGKRTFLVRRGRAWTCGLSAILWVVGSATLTAVTAVDTAVVLAYAVLVVAALFLLR
ncbi:MAG TPA: UbiA family prenyltransferase, partial [Cellulomonadaceae bacterium]|nr:UbiA family prenyltransferase [Cellulomonadaceae bacterium]